ncbi:hypothetical protein LAZ67_23002019 [Cordylochernes scorpioides]|uniref:Transposase n=1 Tax=Cordylochernes scorpioides TaxID=51811 RepID=A0ABY6LU46_9ARAC|nr:hypothetical protein LAZ67_23002019 [Cordylochernes scorpioides]
MVALPGVQTLGSPPYHAYSSSFLSPLNHTKASLRQRKKESEDPKPSTSTAAAAEESTYDAGYQAWIIHHDNAPPHTATSVLTYLAKHSIQILQQPPYSPDLAPNDFFSFQNSKWL